MMKTIYLDWSGDPGFKFRSGASRYLAVACVTDSVPLAGALNYLRERHSLGKTFYFRFTDVSNFIKPVFFSALTSLDFQGVVLRVEKARLGPEFRRRRGLELLAYFVAETVCYMPESSPKARTLIFDGLRSEHALTQTLRVSISAGLRARGLPPLKRVAACPAREYDGLQVADMLAGAAASEHLADNAFFGSLRVKVAMIYGRFV